MEELFTYLNSIYPLSEGLSDHLRNTLQEKSIAKRDYLLKAGRVASNIYFINKGLLRCFYMMDDIPVSAWFMKEGDFCISVESFFQQKPSHEFIQALEPTVLYYLSYDELQVVYEKFPEFNFISRVLTEKYYKLSEERLFSLRMQSAKERYEYLLNHYPNLVRRVPQKYLASYLDMTEVMLSKIRGRRKIS